MKAHLKTHTKKTQNNTAFIISVIINRTFEQKLLKCTPSISLREFPLDLPAEGRCDHRWTSGTWRAHGRFLWAAGKPVESVYSPLGETSPPLEESESSSTPWNISTPQFPGLHWGIKREKDEKQQREREEKKRTAWGLSLPCQQYFIGNEKEYLSMHDTVKHKPSQNWNSWEGTV